MASVLPLAACSLAPEYVRPALPVPMELKTAESITVDGRKSFRSGWREFFTDKRLLALIEAGLESNRDLRLAARSVAEAGMRLRLQNAERLPLLEAQASDVYSGSLREREPPDNQYEATGMLSFELDLFGRLKSMSDAALHSYLGAQEGERAVRIALVAQIARAYLAERLAEEQLELARNTLKVLRESLAFINGRVQAGQSSLLESEQAGSMVESAGISVAQQEREVIQSRTALQLLVGVFEDLPLPPAVPLAKHILAELPQGLSSDVLLNRPDIMEAEHKLMADNADIGAARAAFFPSISLDGSFGYMSGDLNRLVSSATSLWSLLPAIRLPVFTGGRNAANLELAELRKESSIIEYEKAIQTAFREVADTLLSRASFIDQFAAQERYLSAQRRVLELAVSRYTNGVISYLEVLDAQRSIFQAERDSLALRRDQLLNEINLYSALGGGI
jgi:Cu(I)/Ag(I) efflux system outer membrane protein